VRIVRHERWLSKTQSLDSRNSGIKRSSAKKAVEEAAAWKRGRVMWPAPLIADFEGAELAFVREAADARYWDQGKEFESYCGSSGS
jgi:hypothetical protein